MVVVLITLIVGSFVLLQAFRSQLVDNLDVTLTQQVADRTRLLEDGGAKERLTTVLEDESFVWIGSPEGVLSSHGGSIFPLENPVPSSIGTVTTIDLLVEERSSTELETERMELRLASAQASTGQVIVAGSELEAIDKTVADLARLFAFAVPVLVLLVGLLAWTIAGRALAPVAAIRRQAEEITGATLNERVPVPETHDEVEELATTVNQMLGRLERHDVAMRQFSADASHELKSPVANIRALLETTDAAATDWSSVQPKLSRETERLGGLVDNLLFMASNEEGLRRVGQSSVALDELLFAEAELVGATTEVRVDLAQVQPAAISGSASDIGRMIRNLVDNAARHAESKIALALVPLAAEVRLTVSDDGPGIPVHERERIFERFTRLDAARARDDGGTGLGLSIVAQVAEAHGGSVHVESSALGGSDFVVHLPSRAPDRREP